MRPQRAPRTRTLSSPWRRAVVMTEIDGEEPRRSPGSKRIDREDAGRHRLQFQLSEEHVRKLRLQISIEPGGKLRVVISANGVRTLDPEGKQTWASPW